MKQEQTNVDYRSLLEDSLLQLEKMQSKLDALEYARTEPIAVIGMACRFPGGIDNLEALWRVLHDGVDTITEVPKNRWNIDAYYDPDPDATGKIYTRNGGFVNEVDTFDAHFFNISPREAINLDPQQRLLLEVSWQALENAYQVPEQLYKSPAGVFIGICNNDYAKKLSAAEKPDAYLGTGNALSTAAGRLSYFLGLTGPSLAVDTACSSSLVAVHLACQSLRKQECSLALAGGVNLMLSPENSIVFSRARMLSSEGRCKTFDAAADGYVRGEGCGVIVLKRLSDAIKNQDNILSVIRGSAINQDGPSGGLTVPNGPSQEKVIRQALENAGVEPALVSYIEAHGTGTSLGDPIEVNAIGAVFGASHSQEKPLTIGSIKTNIGHLEAAAGIAGLLKVVLQLQHQEIASHLYFKQPNPHINWKELPVVVPTQPIQWSSDSKRRLAGVSSFGFSGTNAHVILEEAPKKVKSEDGPSRPLHLLTLSAKTEKALEALVLSYQNHLETYRSLALADVCFSANTGRSHFNHRLAIIASDQQELADKLAKISATEEPLGVFSGKLPNNNKSPKIAFLFTGQGSQYLNMGRQLYETQPVFRRTLDQCEQILQSYLEQSLLDVIYPENTKELNSSIIDQTAYTQVSLFAIEYALFQLWQSWGIQPTAVMGHSVGEYVAASVAGVFSLEDGLKLIATRGKLMQQLPVGGVMVSLMASVEQVREAIAQCLAFGKTPQKGEVVIAAINGPESTVISGTQEAVQSVVAQLEVQGSESKQLQVSHAFHSPLMQPILAEFEQVAQGVSYSVPRLKLISNVTGQLATEEVTQPEYWCRHILSPVNFALGMETLHQHGCEIFLECGPKRTLLSMAQKCLPKDVGMWLPSLRPGKSDWQQMLASLGELYARGAKVDWAGFDRDYPQLRKVSLPTYPFQRKSYWFTTQNSIAMNKNGLSSNFAQSGIQLEQDDEQNKAQRREKILATLRSLIGSVLQLPPDEVEIDTPLLEMGADSIVFVEAEQKLEKTFGVKLTIRQLFEELNTLDALANYIASHMPDGLESEYSSVDQAKTASIDSSPQPEFPSHASTSNKDPDSRKLSSTETINQQLHPLNSPASSQVGKTALERIMNQQLQTMSQLMTEQISVLREQSIANEALPATQPKQNVTTSETNKVVPASPQPLKSSSKMPQINATKSKEFFWERREYKPALGKRQQSPYEGKTSLSVDKVVQFSLYYFGSYGAEFSKNKYNLLFEGAKFADRNNFTAIWLPERHFHAFGGFSPNPSILAASLARETQSIQLRAGSVVLPLHHPIRVTEDWAIIDNISQGRVGVSFASGWHPHDFVLAPDASDAYERRREIMFEGIETVKKLWRGESMEFIGAGNAVKIETFPMPMQKELPIWVTIVNNPETYIKAGEIGAGVLTNLMGQTIEDFAHNIQLYREALAQNGHDPSIGKVTVLLHTFVGSDLQQVREIARQPFQEYLSSSLGLFKALVKSQGLSVVDFEQISEDDKEYILSAAYERYVQTSALIGTPESCAEVVEKLIDIGVDEIACLIDFGVDSKTVLANLPYLNVLRENFQNFSSFQEGMLDPDSWSNPERENQADSNGRGQGAQSKVALDKQQKSYLEEFIATYTKKSQKSKQRALACRPVLADKRAAVGFRIELKEMKYPIIAESSSGSRIWDIDGNEYIDVSMGFGVHLFGHQPQFLMEALYNQLKQGIQIGPQAELVGDVAQLIHELTGMERVALCNSGTEAVMTALRLARLATDRDKVVIFSGAYHGQFDGTLAIPSTNSAQNFKAVPLLPGVLQNMVNDVIVLPYGAVKSLDIIKAHAHKLAAVLVEPVQSRRPDLQPKDFLQQLRELTREVDIPLIFDEVITGFRIHQGGAQAWFGIEADIATYGKCLGGGIPIGIIAGKAAYLDGIDGGQWNYGDASYPQKLQTFFAGTFNKNPLAMAVALSVLKHLQSEGLALQENLNQRTSNLITAINTYFEQEDVPIKMVNFGSMFRFVPLGNYNHLSQPIELDILFYKLIEKGIYMWEGRNGPACFLSTAHTDEDIDSIISAVKESISEMRQGGFFPKNNQEIYQTDVMKKTERLRGVL